MKQIGARIDIISSQNISIRIATSTNRHIHSNEVCVTVAAAAIISSTGR